MFGLSGVPIAGKEIMKYTKAPPKSYVVYYEDGIKEGCWKSFANKKELAKWWRTISVTLQINCIVWLVSATRIYMK